MERNAKPQLTYFPEWDLKLKNIDSRFEAFKELRTGHEGRVPSTGLQVFYWVGTIDLSQKRLKLHFTNSKGERVLDQYYPRNENFEPTGISDVPYVLETILALTVAILRQEEINWLHLLVEEVIAFDGKHIVKIVTSGKNEPIGYGSVHHFLDEKGKATMKELFKTGLESEKKITILHEEPYSEECLRAFECAA